MATVRHRKKASAHGDSYATPEWLYKALDTEFRFTLDPCPLQPDFDPLIHQDGLALNWDGHRVYCNPPYSNIMPWVEKAVSSKAMTVFLVPCRSDTHWFHLLLASAEIRYFRKRVDFTNLTGHRVHPAESYVVAIVRRHL